MRGRITCQSSVHLQTILDEKSYIGGTTPSETASVCTWAIVYKFERAPAELYTTSKAVKAKIGR